MCNGMGCPYESSTTGTCKRKWHEPDAACNRENMMYQYKLEHGRCPTEEELEKFINNNKANRGE